MKLLTKAIEKSMPPLYSTENDEVKYARVKYFNPCGYGTWYGIEYDPKAQEFFGYVELGAIGEYGYFTLKELESIKLPFGLKIERDMYFKKTDMNEIINEKIV